MLVLNGSHKVNVLHGCNSCNQNNLAGLIHNITGLGEVPFDIASAISAVASLFQSIFGSTAYVDAYHAYADAVSRMPEIANQVIASNNANVAALNQLAALQATAAVLLVDYMNPPIGANFCTSNDKCGNRAD
jgi:hypothetical protein